MNKFTIDGKPATHIFAFSVVFSDEDLELITKALNNTEFKMLVFNSSPQRAMKHGLIDVVYAGSFRAKMSGKSAFTQHVYLKKHKVQEDVVMQEED